MSFGVLRQLLLLGAFLLSLLQTVAPATADAFIPADDDAVLEDVPEPRDAVLSGLREQARRLALHPGDTTQALAVARAYLALGRQRADPRLVGYAQAALQPWWTLPAPPTDILYLRASLRQTLHEFEPALNDLQSYLARQDADRTGRGQALLLRSTILTLLGRPAAAMQDCTALATLADRNTSMLCAAQVDSVGPRAERTLAVLAVYFRQGGLGSTAALRLWGDTLLGELAARLGQSSLAEAAFQAALKEDARDSYLLAAYSDYLLDQGRPKDVERLLKPWLRADPLLLRYAIALKTLGDPQAASFSAQMGMRFTAARERGDHTHKREEARYQLVLRQDAAQALRLAQMNWLVQKEPADLRILAEAALATGDTGSRAIVHDWLQRSGLQDRASPALRALAGPAV